MSNASVTSSDVKEKSIKLQQELESIRALNSSLHVMLDHIKTFRKNLEEFNQNCESLAKVNTEWVDLVNIMMK